MVSIVLGVGALGAALVGGGGAGFYFWKKDEPNRYDASLFINYKSVFNREQVSAENTDALYWKHYEEGFLDDNQATNVAVIGDYKSGKTYVLNKLSGMQLESNFTSSMEGIKFKRTSWIASDKQELQVLLVDTEGLNHLPGDATNRDLMTKRQGYDQLMLEVAVRLADVPILVTDKPSLSFTQRVHEVCTLMARIKGARTLVIVYNFCNIDNKDELYQFFEREVVQRFGCSKYENTIPQMSYHYHNETIAGTTFRIVHLPLGSEKSEAGKHFQKNTFESLRYLVEVEADRKSEAGERKISVKEQLTSLATLYKRVLGVILPKDAETQISFIPLAKA